MIKWNESFSVGIETFDNHHKKLISILNTLIENSNESEAKKDIIYKTIGELIEYTKYHFSAEEEELTRHGYPDLDIQKEEHKDFEATINVFHASFEHDIVPPTADILEFLQNWLKNHIKKSDKNYSTFLKEKGLN